MLSKMPAHEMPKNKMLYFGPKALSNTELLSLVLGTDMEAASNAVSYLDEIGQDFGSVEVRELSMVYGIGEAKASALVAAMELGKRAAYDEKSKRLVDNPAAIAQLMMNEFGHEKREHFVAFLLDSKCQLMSRSVISIGDLTGSIVHPREVFSPAIRQGANGIIVAHNHPSGDPTPSQQDIDVTSRLLEASKIIGIKLLDHVVVGNGVYTSFNDEGLLP